MLGYLVPGQQLTAPSTTLSTTTVPTPRLDLLLQTPAETLAWVESLPPEVRVEVSPEWIARVQNSEPGNPWTLGFSARLRDSGAVVGTCAFKGPPTADGTVEIAYGIAEEYRGCGYASEAASALTTFAFGAGSVRCVRAHTKIDNVASVRVLERCGFRCVGEVVDPDDGLVSRYERVIAD